MVEHFRCDWRATQRAGRLAVIRCRLHVSTATNTCVQVSRTLLMHRKQKECLHFVVNGKSMTSRQIQHSSGSAVTGAVTGASFLSSAFLSAGAASAWAATSDLGSSFDSSSSCTTVSTDNYFPLTSISTSSSSAGFFFGKRFELFFGGIKSD